MPTFDSGSKSSRLLQSKRYTQVELSDSQEAFTRVLDLNASEIYVQQNLIPTSSLPFSGSSQNGNTSGVLKFYYRQRLTPSSVNDLNGKINTFFFISPTSSLQINNGVNPGILDANQQSNFISPKYAPSIANNTENVTPGYQVALTDDNGQLINPINYVFDYKMGVLEFTTVDSGFSGSAFSNAKLYLTAYQYTGLTLDALSTSLTASYAVTASYANTVKAVGPASAVQFSNGSIITGSNRLTFDNNLGSLSIGPGVNPYIAISNGNDTANLFPGILTLNTGGGIASSIYAASTASVVILPNEQDSTILATSVNGQFANNKGNITLTTVPSASYITSSFFTGANAALSSSYALTASYAMNGGGGSTFPYTGNAVITGSLVVINNNTSSLIITSSDAVPAIGQAFQGGKVGYLLTASDPGYDPNYTKGLILSNEVIDTNSWGGTGYYTATSTAIGTGQSNTNLILTSLPSSNPASASNAYVSGGYSDWYLPSVNEASAIFQNYAALSIPTDATMYWTSTEVSTTAVKVLSWNGLTWYSADLTKSSPRSTRAVRSFSIPKTSATLTGSIYGTLTVSKASATVPVIDVTPNTNIIVYASGETVIFQNFSGMIIYTNWNTSNAATTTAMCGGKTVNVQTYAGSFSGFGAWTYNSVTDAYVWTNNTGAPVSASFTAIKTKNST